VRLYRIQDIDLNCIFAESYDIALLASGYESRCTYLPSIIQRDAVERAAVFGFSDFRAEPRRVENDEYYSKMWGVQPVIAESRDDSPIYGALRPLLAETGRPLKVLVDYSSMSRLWYAAALNWARFSDYSGDVLLDFVYSVGAHRDTLAPLVIEDILSIPGCEGGPVPLFKAVAVFGLGFEGLASLCVLDRLEPDIVYSYLASPAAFPDYPDRTRRNNQELLDNYSRVNLELPLASVATAYRLLGELIEPHRADADITLVPMGPKPHVLAAILLALRFEEIACLRVSGGRGTPEEVSSTGEIVATRVHFRP
jgi:hypothetical protein